MQGCCCGRNNNPAAGIDLRRMHVRVQWRIQHFRAGAQSAVTFAMSASIAARSRTLRRKSAARAIRRTQGFDRHRPMRQLNQDEAPRQAPDKAEQGHWELARGRLYAGGARRVWLRRKIIRVTRTA